MERQMSEQDAAAQEEDNIVFSNKLREAALLRCSFSSYMLDQSLCCADP